MLRLLPLVLLLLGCGATPRAPQPVVHRDLGDGVGGYTSIPHGFDTRSYWIEGPEGLVLIDTQFLPSAGVDAVERAEAATGKKVRLAVVLHANPDKFNGTAALQARGIKVVTSAEVIALIPEVHALRTRWFYDRYKPDYPTEQPKPDSFGDVTTELSAGGVTLTAHVLPGPGCSEAHVVVSWRGHVFVGDLVGSNTHAWMELGALPDWRKRIAEIQALQPRHVHPGRGPSAGPELLTAQLAYFDRVEALVDEVARDKPGTEAGVERVRLAMLEAFPDHAYPYFLRVGLPAVWRRRLWGE